MLKLRLREIGAPLSGDVHASAIGPDTAPDERNGWQDSSLDLQRGLDVVELPALDAAPRDGPAPVQASPESVLKRL